MALPDDPLDGCRGPRAPLGDTSTGRGKGMGATLKCDGVAQLKVVVVGMQG
jgi:hypothetical protein